LIALVAGLAVIAPVALVEGIFGPRVYGWFYEPHPFKFDGQERYIGFRPLAFFENGNQYGIWVAATALAAIWLSRSQNRNRVWWILVAVLALAGTFASQSVGAILLLCFGLGLSWAIGRHVLRRSLAFGLLLILMAGAIYFSGVIPLRSLAENTVVGRQIVEIVRSSGRGSFTWRIARDQTALNLIGQHPIFGAGRWDWWRENGQRPWGLALLLVGQFGMIGLVLAFGSLLMPTTYAFMRNQYSSWRQQSIIPLAAIVVMAIADALLNSFFFYPAILAAGALASAKDKLSG
jgi:MFS family permease